MGGTPYFHPKLDHVGIETHGGILHFKKHSFYDVSKVINRIHHPKISPFLSGWHDLIQYTSTYMGG